MGLAVAKESVEQAKQNCTLDFVPFVPQNCTLNFTLPKAIGDLVLSVPFQCVAYQCPAFSVDIFFFRTSFSAAL